MKESGLNGMWNLYFFRQGEYKISHPYDLKNLELTPVQATVPGNVELDLSNAGILPEDLFFAENIKKLKPYELYEWWYEKEFETPECNEADKVELVFRGVDCIAVYWLNGKQIGKSDNMFTEQRFDVTGMLCKKGTNTLVVQIKSPIVEAMEKIYDPTGTIWHIDRERQWIRKPPHCYGWDIMPRALSAGLWRPVELVFHNEHEICDIYFNTHSIDHNTAKIKLNYTIRTKPDHLDNLELEIRGKCGQSEFHTKQKISFVSGEFCFGVQNPELWWPKGYGEPNLYSTDISLLYKDCVIAGRKEILGIRTLELDRSEVTTCENPGRFLFRINGVPIMCKGTNWVPADVFHSRDSGRIKDIIDMAVDLNCNILRCWGGNVYEDHMFFNLCDSNGLMVWQDFAMACAAYPQAPEFYKAVEDEAVSVVRKLRKHPCIVIWCGDNECDYCYGDPSKNRITREILPNVVFRCDPYRPYLPSSPYMSREYSSGKDRYNMPENHIWGPRNYFKSRFYTGNESHFISEIGYHGCPGISSIKKFVDRDRIWPWQDNEQWILHSTDFKNNPYRIELMARQVKELFGTIPDNLEDFVAASQITQAEAKKFFIEMIRLKKWTKTGIIWWNVMDGWPQFSDAVVDYYFNKKLAYYYIRRVQQPVCIMVDEPSGWRVRVVAGNDSQNDMSGQYRIWDCDTGETLLEGDFLTKANSNSELGSFKISESDKRLFLIQWTVSDKKYGNHYLQGFPPFSLETYKRWISEIAALQDDFNAESIGR